MLKLTYTENSFYIECLNQPLEEWVSQRVILALRVSQSLFVQPSTASFLLPADLPGLEQMKASVCRDDREIISLYNSDAEYVEVTLYGSWLCNNSEDANGVFVAKLSDRTECFLHKLWQEAQACISAEC